MPSVDVHGPRPVTANRFLVTVGRRRLGAFHSVTGLGFDIDVETVLEGGENYTEHRLPGRIKWQNIVLRRGILSGDVLSWWVLGTSEATALGLTGSAYSLGVTLLDESGEEAYAWSFLGAFPVSWKGPDLSTASDEIAAETLEVAHRGLAPSSY